MLGNGIEKFSAKNNINIYIYIYIYIYISRKISGIYIL